MSEQNKEFMYTWFEEVWNKGNEGLIKEMFHPQCQAHGLGNAPVIGPEEFIVFYRSFNQMLKDIHITVTRLLTDGDFVTAMCTVAATDRKTGKAVSFDGVSIAEIENGQLINGWNYFDFLGLNIQLGNIRSKDLF